jgi:hypothetical protein
MGVVPFGNLFRESVWVCDASGSGTGYVLSYEEPVLPVQDRSMAPNRIAATAYRTTSSMQSNPFIGLFRGIETSWKRD